MALPYLPVLLDSRLALLYRDLSNVWIPFKITWAKAFLELGRIPHWDPLHEAGTRFIANLNYGPLYPLNWLFLALLAATTPARAFTFFVFFHHVLLYAGTFGLLRDFRLRAPLCLAGALAAAWAGNAVSADNLVHMLGAQAALPFLFWFWRRALRKERARWWSPELFLASAALAWPVYSGDPQSSYLAAPLLVLVAALSRSRLKIRLCVSLFCLSALAAAPQLFSTLHYLWHSTRMQELVSEQVRFGWSLHPWRALELLFPLAFGSHPREFWAGSLLGGAQAPFVFSLYVGAAPLFFAFWQLGLAAGFRHCRARLRAGQMLAIFLGFLFLSMGENSPIPLFQLFARWLPFWDGFRYPERLGIWLSWCVLLYGFLGAEKALRLRHARFFWAPLFLLALPGAAFSSWLLVQGASLAPVVRTLALAALLSLGWWRARTASRRAYFLLALVLADTAPIANQLVWAQPAELADLSSYPWARKILSRYAEEAGLREKGEAHRFISAAESAPVMSKLPDAGSGLDQFAYSAWAGMKFNTPSSALLPLARGHTSLSEERPVLSLTRAGPEFAQRALDLLNVRYLLDAGDPPQPVLRASALPQVLFPDRVEEARSAQELAEKLKAARWDIHHVALVESTLAGGAQPAQMELLSLRRDWDQIRVRVRAREQSNSQWLLLGEGYDPLWHASAGKSSLPLARANGWALAALLPSMAAGEELEVFFTFHDDFFVLGLGGLLLWILAFASSALLAAPLRKF